MKKMRNCLAFLATIALAASFGFSQTTGQRGQIVATVLDRDGTPLPGVMVSISSPAMVVAKMVRSTNTNGVVRFPALTPGTYEVKSELEGFNTSIRKGVIVNAGTTAAIDLKMSITSLSEEIAVIGQSPTIDTQSTTKNAILDTELLASMPIARDINSVFNTTPGVTANTAHGSTVRDNSYSIDGVNVSDSTTGVLANDFSLDIAEEISVQTGGLPAEYGQVRGAVVNVVSKAGGNEFHGKMDVFYRGSEFQSDNKKGTALEGQKSGFRYEIEPGISLGGPIIKDKLWFFGNLSFYKQQYYEPGFPYDKDEEVPIAVTRPYPYLKLSFQPNQDNKFILSYGFSNSVNKNNYASRYNIEATTWETSTETHIVNFIYTRFFNPNFYANVKASAWLSGLYRFAKTKGPVYIEDTNYLRSGSYGWDDDNPRRHFSIEADGTLFVEDLLGSHELKFGASFRKAIEIRECTMHEKEGTPWAWIYTLEGVPFYGEFYEDIKWENLLHDYGFFVSDNWNPIKNLTLNLGLRFEIDKGMWPPQNENEEFYQLPFEGALKVDRSIKETMTVYNWKNLSPRLGLLYDISGDGKTLLKGSYSKYMRGNIATWVGRGNPNAWIGFGAFINPDYSLDYIDYVSYAGKALAPQYGYKDFELKCPYTNEFTVGIERELMEDWSVGLRYITKDDKNTIDDVDASALDIDKLLTTGEMDWIGYTPVQGVDPYNGAPVTFYSKKASAAVSKIYLVNVPNAPIKYQGVEFTIDKRHADNWQIHFSYTYGKSTGLIPTDFSSGSAWGTGFYGNPNSHVNAEGRFPYERRHQLKLTASVKGPFGINFGTYTRFLSGQRYTRTISSRYVGVNLRQGNTTIYAEPLGSRGLPDQLICDLRAEKAFKLGKTKLGVFGEVFNLFNGNKATDVIRNSSNPVYTFEEMTYIMAPRIFRIGAKFEW